MCFPLGASKPLSSGLAQNRLAKKSNLGQFRATSGQERPEHQILVHSSIIQVLAKVFAKIFA
jgi:hypothetical protein